MNIFFLRVVVRVVGGREGGRGGGLTNERPGNWSGDRVTESA